MFSKILAFAFAFLFVITASGQETFLPVDTAVSNNCTQQLSQHFLHFNPYQTHLPDIITILLDDKDFSVDTTIKKTDTSNFYLRGYHKSDNPFAVPLDSVRTIISEGKLLQPHAKIPIGSVFRFQKEGIVVGVDKLAALKIVAHRLDDSITKFYSHREYNNTKQKHKLIGEGFTYDSLSPYRSINITWQMRNELEAVICITFYGYNTK